MKSNSLFNEIVQKIYKPSELTYSDSELKIYLLEK